MIAFLANLAFASFTLSSSHIPSITKESFSTNHNIAAKYHSFSSSLSNCVYNRKINRRTHHDHGSQAQILHGNSISSSLSSSAWIYAYLLGSPFRIPSSYPSSVCSMMSDSSSNKEDPTSNYLQKSHTSLLKAFTEFCNALWLFSRPHTIIGTVISILSVTLTATLQFRSSTNVALSASSITCLFFHALAGSLPAALLLNVFIVGLNQLYDIEIDRINKPDLPLAAGLLSLKQGQSIVWFTLIAGLFWGCSVLSSAPLVLTLVGSVVLGTLYSMPPFRLKRYPLFASFAILSVRGALVNLGFFAHTMQILESGLVKCHAWAQSSSLSSSASSSLSSSSSLFSLGAILANPWASSLICIATFFFVIFGVVIALMKDVPDIKGDRLYHINSFSVRWGPRKAFNLCIGTLLSLYTWAALSFPLVSTNIFQKTFTFVYHAVVAMWIFVSHKKVDTEVPRQIYNYYMKVWIIFYMQYLMLPFAAAL